SFSFILNPPLLVGIEALDLPGDLPDFLQRQLLTGNLVVQHPPLPLRQSFIFHDPVDLADVVLAAHCGSPALYCKDPSLTLAERTTAAAGACASPSRARTSARRAAASPPRRPAPAAGGRSAALPW